MNDRNEVEKLAKYFGLLEPNERLSFIRSWYRSLVEERGDRGCELLRKLYNQLEGVYLDSDGKLSEWIKKKLVEDRGLTPTEFAEEAYRARKLRQVDITYLKYPARRVKTGLWISKQQKSKKG